MLEWEGRRLFVFSDFHLGDAATDPIYEATLRRISTLQNGDYLVIAGDFFDLFVGDSKLFLERYAPLLTELGRATQARGVHVYYLEGNHDFLLGPALAKFGIQVVRDDCLRFTMGGRSFYIAHGDLVDQGDLQYLRLRRFFRGNMMRTIVRL
ncbi:MAG: metallophosphoesterase, partial [Bdellovibrionota bacterium]